MRTASSPEQTPDPPADDGLLEGRAHRMTALAGLAQRQHDLLHRQQLLQVGWSEGQIQHELRIGRWRTPVPGVVCLHNSTVREDQLPWLGLLHAGSAAVLSHLTVLHLHGLTWRRQLSLPDEPSHSSQVRPRALPPRHVTVDPEHELVDILTAKGELVPPLPGFSFHQTRRPYQRWLESPDDGPPRLRVEHAALLTAERQRSVRAGIGLLAACVQQRLTTVDALTSALPAIRKLRHGAYFRLALGDIAGGAESFAELDLGRLCLAAGMPAPQRQTVRRDKEGRRRYLDCRWRLRDGRFVVLEVDGAFHLEVEHWWRDMRRERAIVTATAEQTVVLRCSSVELRVSPRDVLDDLARVGVPRKGFVCAPSA